MATALEVPPAGDPVTGAVVVAVASVVVEDGAVVACPPLGGVVAGGGLLLVGAGVPGVVAAGVVGVAAGVVGVVAAGVVGRVAAGVVAVVSSSVVALVSSSVVPVVSSSAVAVLSPVEGSPERVAGLDVPAADVATASDVTEGLLSNEVTVLAAETTTRGFGCDAGSAIAAEGLTTDASIAASANRKPTAPLLLIRPMRK